jgi:hypothetical protein
MPSHLVESYAADSPAALEGRGCATCAPPSCPAARPSCTSSRLRRRGGIAYATIPDSNKVFTACMLKNVGRIRLIDPSLAASSAMSHGSSLEMLVSWSEQGGVGQSGPSGPPGSPGRPAQAEPTARQARAARPVPPVRTVRRPQWSPRANRGRWRPGPSGPPGGLSGYEVVTATLGLAALGYPTGSFGTSVFCPPGKHVLGSGVQRLAVSGAVVVTRPQSDGGSWVGFFNVEVYPMSGFQPSITVWAICAVTS